MILYHSYIVLHDATKKYLIEAATRQEADAGIKARHPNSTVVYTGMVTRPKPSLLS